MTHSFNAQIAGEGSAAGRGHEARMSGVWHTSDQINRARRWMMAAGVLTLIVGAVSILVPVIATVTAAIFVGWVLVASGIAIAIQAISHRALIRGLEAVITLAAGLCLLVFPLQGALTLTLVLAVWFFASGLLTLTHAIESRHVPGYQAHALGAMLSVILGFMIVASLPSSATWAIGLLLGVDLIFWGVRAIVTANLLRGVARSM